MRRLKVELTTYGRDRFLPALPPTVPPLAETTASLAPRSLKKAKAAAVLQDPVDFAPVLELTQAMTLAMILWHTLSPQLKFTLLQLILSSDYMLGGTRDVDQHIGSGRGFTSEELWKTLYARIHSDN